MRQETTLEIAGRKDKSFRQSVLQIRESSAKNYEPYFLFHSQIYYADRHLSKVSSINSKNKGIRFRMPRKVIRLFRVGSGDLRFFIPALELGH